jgi:hypothetical protein
MDNKIRMMPGSLSQHARNLVQISRRCLRGCTFAAYIGKLDCGSIREELEVFNVTKCLHGERAGRAPAPGIPAACASPKISVILGWQVKVGLQQTVRHPT